MMFSQDESNVVSGNIRGGDDLDASSVRSSVPTSIKDRSQRERIIGGTDELQDTGRLNINHLNLNGNPAVSSLPGVYKHVSLWIFQTLGYRMFKGFSL